MSFTTFSPWYWMSQTTATLKTILANQEKIMSTLDQTNTDVAQLMTDEANVATLIQNQTALIQQLQSSGLNPAQQALVDQIDANAQKTHAALAALVAPPVAPVAPPAPTS